MTISSSNRPRIEARANGSASSRLVSAAFNIAIAVMNPDGDENRQEEQDIRCP